MAKHAKLSPSSHDRWGTCPGSVVLSEGVVEEASSYADEGTAAHYLASECLLRGEDAAVRVGQSIYLLKTKEEHCESYDALHLALAAKYTLLGTYVVNDTMAEHVQVYLDYVRDVVVSTGGVLLVEQRVPLSHITGEEGAGTSDAIVVTDDELHVIDLKYGYNEVLAEENLQLLDYASGAVSNWELVNDFKRIRLAISQPRVSRAPSEWDCDMGYLREHEERTRSQAGLVESAKLLTIENLGGYLQPSDKGCKWCKVKATCPALATFVQESLGSDFDNLLLEKTPDAKAYDAATLSVKMACLDLIDEWSKAVRAKVESELLLGHEIEGWKLVQGRKGSRAWTNAEEAEALLKSMRLKVNEMYDFKLISPTTCEKVLKENPKKWVKAQALIGQSEGKASVAPATDKRPALVVTPTSDDFDNLVEGELA